MQTTLNVTFHLLFNATEHISGPWLCFHLKVKRTTGSASPCYTGKIHGRNLVEAHVYGGLVHKYEASFQRVKHSTSSFVRTRYTAEPSMAAKQNNNTGINHHHLWFVLTNSKVWSDCHSNFPLIRFASVVGVKGGRGKQRRDGQREGEETGEGKRRRVCLVLQNGGISQFQVWVKFQGTTVFIVPNNKG